MKHALPEPGDRVAYTRDFIMNVRDRSDWRGVIVERCGYATSTWPMVVVLWDDGVRNDVNANNLCKLRSVAFVESAAKPYSLLK